MQKKYEEHPKMRLHNKSKTHKLDEDDKAFEGLQVTILITVKNRKHSFEN